MTSQLIARPLVSIPASSSPVTSSPALPAALPASVVDAVPEFYHYEDTGCEVSASCLNCPLPQCKYDDPVWYQRNRRLARDFKVWSAIQQDDLTVDEAAERYSVTVRTIFRIMQRCREASLEVGSDELLAFAAD